MIFITTGTSLPHDELIKEIDSLKSLGYFGQDRIYAQIGNGKYIPNHMKWLRFVGNMEETYEHADIIISNCGAGTIMENVTKGRKLIAVQNPGITGGHEWELVSKLEKMGCLIWCKDVKDIKDCIEMAKKETFNKFEGDKFDISLITDLLRRTEMQKFERKCATCGKKLTILVAEDKTYSGGYFFFADVGGTGPDAEYWECNDCFNAVDVGGMDK